MKKRFNLFSLLMAMAVLLSACGGSAQTEITSSNSATGKVVEYSLMTNMVDGKWRSSVSADPTLPPPST